MGYFKNKVIGQEDIAREDYGLVIGMWRRLMNVLGDPNRPMNGRAKRFIFEPDGGRWKVIYMNTKQYFYLDELDKQGEVIWRDL